MAAALYHCVTKTTVHSQYDFASFHSVGNVVERVLRKKNNNKNRCVYLAIKSVYVTHKNSEGEGACLLLENHQSLEGRGLPRFPPPNCRGPATWVSRAEHRMNKEGEEEKTVATRHVQRNGLCTCCRVWYFILYYYNILYIFFKALAVLSVAHICLCLSWLKT